MPGITLENVSKSYDGEQTAVDNVCLDISDGEFMVFVGPSGCGKSTMLKMIAGLEPVTDGTILIGENDVTPLSAGERDIAMVFQNYALYPHMSVRRNLGYGLRVRGEKKDVISRRVQDVAELLSLEGTLDRRPSELSGGQRQRVAMGRAIVREPAAFLMDEPLSNLDAKLRVGMRAQLSQLHARLATTTIYVTHDQIEAMTLGERVAVINKGQIQQVDSPQTLYADPTNIFVAAFIGSPSMNLAPARLTADGIAFGSHQISIPPGLRPQTDADHVFVGIRPQDLHLDDAGGASDPRIDVIASAVERLGTATHVFFSVGTRPVTPVAGPDIAGPDQSDQFLFRDDEQALFTAALGPHAAAERGQMLRLTFAPERLYFFDAANGHRIPASSELRRIPIRYADRAD